MTFQFILLIVVKKFKFFLGSSYYI